MGSCSLLVNYGSLTIKNNSERAISAYLADLSFSSSSQTLIEGNNSNNSRGISIGDGTRFKINGDLTLSKFYEGIVVGSGALMTNNGSMKISESSKYSLAVWAGSFQSFSSGALSLENLKSGRALSADRSNLEIRNLKISGIATDSSDSLVSISKSTIYFKNSEIKNHSYRMLNLSQTNANIDNMTLKSNVLLEKEILNMHSSNVEYKNTSISCENIKNNRCINANNNSGIGINNSTITCQLNNQNCIDVGGSVLEIYDTNISSNSSDQRALYITNNSYFGAYDSTLTSANSEPVKINFSSSAWLENSSLIKVICGGKSYADQNGSTVIDSSCE